MFALSLALAMQIVQSVDDAPPAATWSELPALPITAAPSELAAMSGFVAAEVAAGRCGAAMMGPDGTTTLTVPMIAHRLTDGQIDAIRPQAIDCPTVEQYAAGLLHRLATRALAVPPPRVATWYRAELTFRWSSPPAPR